jgi:hypothetical protein
MATIGNIKKKKLEAARLRRVVRGAVKMGNPLPGHGKNTPTADVERLKEQVGTILPYWGKA